MIERFFKKLLPFLFSVLSLLTVEASSVVFYNVNNIFGISMREANSVCRDNEGFIWASSKTGILRLTNDDYRIYQIPYETANVISVNLVYSDSKLLAYTNNGQVFLFNKILDQFELQLNLSKILNSNFLSVTSLLIDEYGSYWISTSTGLFKYSNDQLTRIGDDNSNVSRMVWYTNQKLIVAKGLDLFMLDIQNSEWELIYHCSEVPALRVSNLFIDSTMSKLWIGTISSGLFTYDFNSKKYSPVEIKSIPHQPILAIESNTDSTLLIGIDGQGIWEINKDGDRILKIEKENVDNPFSLRGNGVYDIFCDQNNRVWICTYSGGLSYFEQASPIVTQITHQTNNANSLVNNDVNGVIEDSDGKLWFATNNGISCWDVKQDRWKSYYGNKQEQAQVFLTLCEDNQGRIWAGTYSSGVYLLDAKTGKELAHYSTHEKDSPILNDFVFDIFKDSEGDIWIGGINSDVICYDNQKNTFRNYSNQPIYVLDELTPNEILFGCTYGLSLSDKTTGNLRILVDKCLVEDILVLDKEIWICTSGDGLIQYNTVSGEKSKFTMEEGLPSNFVTGIEYSNGYLWLGTENGICRFNPSAKSIVAYSSIYSLTGLSVNRGSHFKLSDGQLVWGTNKGVVIFNPELIEPKQMHGQVYLQNISITGRSIHEIPSFKLTQPVNDLTEMKLKYGQNTIAIEVLPIGVASGSKFSWMMDGLDKEWNQPTSNRVITYTNIPAKELSLKIKMFDNSLSHVIGEREILIAMTPPFWGTWWFLIVMFILVSGIIYFSLWYYINILKQRHTEEKVRFFTNTAHEIRTSLTLIKAPVEELAKEKNLSETGTQYLNLAIEQASRLSSVVTQLMDFQKVDIGKAQLSLSMVDLVKLIENRIRSFKSIAENSDVKLSFTCNQPDYFTAIDETMIEKVIDNLISNAVKYSLSEGLVSIDLKCDESKWTLEVKDHGIGISRKVQRQLFKEFYRGENAINAKIVGSGIGLLLVKNYVGLHGGEVELSSQEDIGSSFQITIPFKEVQVATNHNEYLLDAGFSFAENENVLVSSDGDYEESTEKDMSILIVEDNDDLRSFMQTAFKDEYEVFTAEDGVRAWDLIQNQLPDLVISDVMMPKMDGFELCQVVKSNYATSHVPIVLLTALSEKTEQLHGLGLGADDYLTKPFDLILLKQKIRSIIQNRKAVREKTLKLIKGNNNKQILFNQHNDHFIKKMMEVVVENISNTEFKKNEFASAMNVSSSLLYKKVKSLTDQSPSDFIKTVRLDNALELLESGKYTVTEVSELIGFTSVSYFSTVFKKHFGKSPTEI